MSTAYLAAAAIALGQAIQIHDGFYDPSALPWLTLALACSALGVAVPRATRDWHGLVAALLIAGVLWQLTALWHARPAHYLETRDLRLFRRGIAIEGLVVLLGLVPWRWTRAVWFPLLLAIHVPLGLWVLHWAPSPHIDVITVTNAALRALWHGHNPYAITFPDIYGTGPQLYGAGAVANGRVLFGYPYPPLSLVMVLPGYLLGDYRYASLVIIVGAAALAAYARPSQHGRLAATLFLTTPRVFYVLEQGWSEPVSVLFLSMTLFAMCRRPDAAAWIAGLTIASKQYLVVGLPLLWRYASAHAPPARQFVTTALAAAAALLVPFILWGPRAFVRDIVLVQAREPFRLDALSYLSWLARHGWGEPSFAWTAAAIAVAMAVVIARSNRSPEAFAASLAFVTLAAFTFGRKAFCNYYFFVIAALCSAVAIAPDWQPDMMANKRRTTHEPAVRPRS